MVRLTDRPDMTVDFYRGRKTTTQQEEEDPLRSLHYEIAQAGVWSVPLLFAYSLSTFSACRALYQGLSDENN